ncbi:MerR family transcriptional regulator [Thalassomonas sp. M1454]|uniref:MerR family transcriptional regulator n=1 Tax=Thalassomonas sp. M1454 TaxID=2594477 RepID=UPI00117E1B52|nr:MerR family transcriptional regulator [Thalassomonas sp. M1454]TRX55742.1 MerR family transcriptional regulator [Thalassomonas sp. M1454]
MYRISELASKVGLSRTAILYYEKQQLIKGKRLDNGYRVYSDKDLQRIRLIQQLQAGGLSLKECKACVEEKIDRVTLNKRLRILDDEIKHKQEARKLLNALLGDGDLKVWHETVDKIAPDAHLHWLFKQGFDEKEALRLKWLTKDMNKHDEYMADFMKVFSTLERWGPGSQSETKKALSSLPQLPKNILEIGCGKGIATNVLAQNTTANITTVDNEESAIAYINDKIASGDLSSRVTPVCASMTELPFADKSFDLIWSEASAYIMGVSKALTQWKALLSDDGILMISDLVWLTPNPSDAAVEFWNKNYPDIVHVNTRIKQMQDAGYEIVESFTLSEQAWENYCLPLKNRVEELQHEMQGSQALQDIHHELDIYNQFLGEFGYQMFILKK